jgi:hypothetical protein
MEGRNKSAGGREKWVGTAHNKGMVKQEVKEEGRDGRALCSVKERGTRKKGKQEMGG